MSEEIIASIKERLNRGEDMVAIIESLQGLGLSREQINESIKAAMQRGDVGPINEAGGGQRPSTQAGTFQQEGKSFDLSHLDITKAFIVIGSLLIAAAVIIVTYSQWLYVSPAVRILFLAVPMAILFALSFALSRHEKQQEVSMYLLVVALFILPFFIGTFLFQTKIIGQLDSFLVFVSAFISALIYVAFEVAVRKKEIAILSVASMYVSVLTLLAFLEVEPIPYSWAIFFFSLLLALVSVLLSMVRFPSRSTYAYAGTALSLLLFPGCIFATLNDAFHISPELNSLLLSLIGVFYLSFVPFFNNLRSSLDDVIYYNLKRMVEEIAPIMVLVPFITTGFDNTLFSFIACLLGALYIFINTKVRIWSLAFVGSLGVLVPVLTISSKLFEDSISWPIAVFLAGFTAIGMGIGIKKFIADKAAMGEAPMLHGFGRDPLFEDQRGQRKHIGLVGGIFILIAFIYLLNIIISLISMRNF